MGLQKDRQCRLHAACAQSQARPLAVDRNTCVVRVGGNHYRTILDPMDPCPYKNVTRKLVEIMNIRLTLTAILFGFAGPSAFAQGIGANYSDTDSSQNIGVQFEVCALNEDADLTDIVKLNHRVGAELAKLNINASFMQLTPFYASGMPAEPRVDYINMLVGPIAEFGAGWDKWWISPEANKLMDEASNKADCRLKFSQGIQKYMDTDEILNTDRRIISLEWCARRPGVSYEQLRNRHNNLVARLGDDMPSATWHILVPRLGNSSVGRFAHMNTYTSAAALMANEERYAGPNGFQGYNDYHDAYVECDGRSVWNGTYFHKRQ